MQNFVRAGLDKIEPSRALPVSISRTYEIVRPPANTAYDLFTERAVIRLFRRTGVFQPQSLRRFKGTPVDYRVMTAADVKAVSLPFVRTAFPFLKYSA